MERSGLNCFSHLMLLLFTGALISVSAMAQGAGWQKKTVVDPMTDERSSTYSAVLTANDGRTFVAKFNTIPGLADFTLTATRRGDLIQTASSDSGLAAIRTRLDSREVVIAQSDTDPANQIDVMFYTEAVAGRTIADESEEASRKNAEKIAGKNSTVAGYSALSGALGGLFAGFVLQARSAGTVAELAAAHRLRIEIPLKGGVSPVVTLNLDDPVLRAAIADCAARTARIQKQVEAEQQAAKQKKAEEEAAREKAEQERVAAEKQKREADRQREIEMREQSRLAALHSFQSQQVPVNELNRRLGTFAEKWSIKREHRAEIDGAMRQCLRLNFADWAQLQGFAPINESIQRQYHTINGTDHRVLSIRSCNALISLRAMQDFVVPASMIASTNPRDYYSRIDPQDARLTVWLVPTVVTRADDGSYSPAHSREEGNQTAVQVRIDFEGTSGGRERGVDSFWFVATGKQ